MGSREETRGRVGKEIIGGNASKRIIEKIWGRRSVMEGKSLL